MNQLLSSNPFWLQAAALCEYGYSLLDKFPKEEDWGMMANLRKHSFNLSNDVSGAIGGSDPRSSYHAFDFALRDLAGLKNCLTMAKRAGYISPDPDMMLTIEKLNTDMVAQQAAAFKSIQTFLRQFDPITQPKPDTEPVQKTTGAAS